MHRADDQLQQLTGMCDDVEMIINKLWHAIGKLFSSENKFIHGTFWIQKNFRFCSLLCQAQVDQSESGIPSDPLLDKWTWEQHVIDKWVLKKSELEISSLRVELTFFDRQMVISKWRHQRSEDIKQHVGDRTNGSWPVISLTWLVIMYMNYFVLLRILQPSVPFVSLCSPSLLDDI